MLSLLGRNLIPGQTQLHRPVSSDRTQQELGSAGTRHDADADFRLAEARALPRDDDVRVQRQLTTTAQRVSLHGGDHRLGAGAQRDEDLVCAQLGMPLGGHVPHFGDVGPGDKGLLDVMFAQGPRPHGHT